MAAMEEGNGLNSVDSSQYGSISNFEIEKKIGRGQFSVVYRARCLVDNSIVALKKVQVSLKHIFYQFTLSIEFNLFVHKITYKLKF